MAAHHVETKTALRDVLGKRQATRQSTTARKQAMYAIGNAPQTGMNLESHLHGGTHSGEAPSRQSVMVAATKTRTASRVSGSTTSSIHSSEQSCKSWIVSRVPVSEAGATCNVYDYHCLCCRVDPREARCACLPIYAAGSVSKRARCERDFDCPVAVSHAHA